MGLTKVFMRRSLHDRLEEDRSSLLVDTHTHIPHTYHTHTSSLSPTPLLPLLMSSLSPSLSLSLSVHKHPLWHRYEMQRKSSAREHILQQENTSHSKRAHSKKIQRVRRGHSAHIRILYAFSPSLSLPLLTSSLPLSPSLPLSLAPSLSLHTHTMA